MPNPPIDGGAQVMHFTTKGLLANGVNVKTLAINPIRNFINTDLLPNDYIANTRFESVIVDTAIKPLNIFTNIFKKESYFVERFISTEFDEKIKSILQSEHFDIIQLEHLYICKYINTIRKYSKAKIILRPQNVEYVIWERYTKNVKNLFKKYFLKLATIRLKKFEQNVIAYLDGIIALTKEDADLFLTFSNPPPTIIVPMGYDYEKIRNYDFNKQFNYDPIIYHLGSMDWMPNIEAINWFIRDVMPFLVKYNFSGKIIVAGRRMPLWVFKYKSKILEVIDEVKNPIEFQEDKQIMIVPLWSGSGIRAKIIEGLALGKIIISTSIGAQGIDYVKGENLLIADTPEEFAKQIINCVNSKGLCINISKNARALSLNSYHFKNTANKMILFYEKLLESNE